MASDPQQALDPVAAARAAQGLLGLDREDVEAVVVACVPYLVVELDTGTIVMTSPLTSRAFGYVPGELVGRSVHDLVPERLRAQHRGHFAGFANNPADRPMGTIGMKLVGLRRDGSEIPVQIGLVPWAWGGRRFVVATVLPLPAGAAP